MANPPADIRWSDPGLLVLCSLADGPRHGYAITQDVQAHFGVALGPGTLYGVLARLEERGLVEPLPADERRRPYRITADGERHLAAQVDALTRVAQVGRDRLERRAGRGPAARPGAMRPSASPA